MWSSDDTHSIKKCFCHANVISILQVRELWHKGITDASDDIFLPEKKKKKKRNYSGGSYDKGDKP